MFMSVLQKMPPYRINVPVLTEDGLLSSNHHFRQHTCNK